MAACSELETEGKPLQEKRLLCSKSFDSSTNKEDAFDSQKTCNSEMSKSVVPNENTVDICSLTEEQLHSLLEEATTFNRPKEQDSSILRALRKEIVESDPCGDVNSSDSSSLSVAAAGVATVAVHSKRKGGRNISATSYSGTRNKTQTQITDDQLMVNHQSVLQGWTKSEINASNRRRWQPQSGKGGGNRDDYLGVNARRELQSQSLQDLPSTRFNDPLDSMRAAGIGRGSRRLQNATRANSFTYTGDGADWLGIPALQSQVSTLEGVRTSGRSSKNKTKSKTTSGGSVSGSSNNPQTVLTIEDETDLARGANAISSSVATTDATDIKPPHSHLGPKGWSRVTAPVSSPDGNVKTPLLTFASCDNCEQSEVSLLSCRPLNDEVETLENVKSNINGGLGVIEGKIEAKSGGVSLPLEIEMMELDKGKCQSMDLDSHSSFVYNLDGNCRGGGIDSRSEVDATLHFPLKSATRICPQANKNEILCTSIRNPGTINGILPMTDRSESVKSIIGTDDSRKGSNNACKASMEIDKLLNKKKFMVQQAWPDDLLFYQNVDYNGNASQNLMRISNSFLSQGYSFENHPSITKGDLSCANSSLTSRKAKRSKSNAEKETYSKAEDVAGFCGNLGIDQLLEFINSSGNDKKKPGSKGSSNLNTGNLAFNNTKNGNVDIDKKPRDKTASNNRESLTHKSKSVFKRKSGGVSSSGSSEEHNGPEPDMHDHRQQSGDSDEGDTTPRIQSPVSDVASVKGGDEVEKPGLLQHSVPSSTKEKISTSTPVSLNPIEHADFVEDFYAVSEIEIGQVPVEEPEFRVVVNKQRKKKQARKSEPFRRYSNSGNNPISGDRSGNAGSSSERDFYLPNQSSGMIIYSGLSHRNQRGKPDPNRRKSTSSMPPSEPSSADNSDLDSVHSLPVVGSIPPNTGPHPHTTPSSMSTTPQASYADIARMASSGTYPTKKVEVTTQSDVNPHDAVLTAPKDAVPSSSQPKPAAPVAETHPVSVVPCHDKTAAAPSCEKPSLVHVSTSPMVSIPTGLAKPKAVNPIQPEVTVKMSPIVVAAEKTELNPEVDKNIDELPIETECQEPVISVKDKPEMVSQPSVTANPHNPQTPTSEPASVGTLENPPVIQSSDASRVCDVSFGFDLNELMRLSEGGVPVTFEFEQSTLPSPPAGHVLMRGLTKDATDASSTHSSLSEATNDSASFKTETGVCEPSPCGAESSLLVSPSLVEFDSLNVPPEVSDNQSSPGENVVVVSGGKRLQFKEKVEETLNFNHVQVVNFFGSAWDNTIQDYHKDGADVSGRPESRRSGRICYYNSSQC